MADWLTPHDCTIGSCHFTIIHSFYPTARLTRRSRSLSLLFDPEDGGYMLLRNVAALTTRHGVISTAVRTSNPKCFSHSHFAALFFILVSFSRSLILPCFSASSCIYFRPLVSQSYITTDGQSASLSWCQDPLGPATSFPLALFLDSYGFIDVGRPP
jgi:hypothetical protein